MYSRLEGERNPDLRYESEMEVCLVIEQPSAMVADFGVVHPMRSPLVSHRILYRRPASA